MFDALTIAAVADELSETVLDGRIQRIGLVDARTLAAEIYAGGRRHALVVSADDRRARLLLVDALPSLDADLVTPFVLLLRKYARGGVVVGIEQPPLERLVRLSIAKRLWTDHERRRRGIPADLAAEPEPDPGFDPADEEPDDEGEGDATFVHLSVEIMGRHSNLILVDDAGAVMESVKRVTPAMSRVRPVLPRLPYTPPPPLLRADPRRLSTAETERLLATSKERDRPLWRALIAWLRGVSPQMAREIAYRAAGDADVAIRDVPDESAASIARETRALLEPLLTSTWSPRVYREPPAGASDTDESGANASENGEPGADEPAAGEPGIVVAFAPVPMGHLRAEFVEEAVTGISRAAALFEGEDGDAASPVRHAQRRERLQAAIGAARERQQRRSASLAGELRRAAEAERWRRWGELIFAYLWQIEPGQAALEVDGETIPLDPGRPAKETAQEYFERYRKAQGAAAQLPERQQEVEAELAYLDQLALLVAQAPGFSEIEALATEWEAHAGAGSGAGAESGTRDGVGQGRQASAGRGAGAQGRGKSRAQAPKRPQPLLDAEGNAVFVGHTGPQNDLVTFELVGPDDTWLHARGVAGSHVVVRWQPGRAERPATVEAAARLAAFYSAARAAGSVEVDVTQRRHVRKIKGGRPGLVTYRNERTVSVRPADERALADVLRGADARGA